MSAIDYSVGYDYYGGMIPPQAFGEGNTVRELPVNAKRIVGFEVCISTFATKTTGTFINSVRRFLRSITRAVTTESGLHIDVWCTLNHSSGKEGPGIFATGKTGDTGNSINSLIGLNIPVPSRKLFINFWYHNMRSTPDDWHVGVVIYYRIK